jgi:hypothetical protein
MMKLLPWSTGSIYLSIYLFIYLYLATFSCRQLHCMSLCVYKDLIPVHQRKCPCKGHQLLQSHCIRIWKRRGGPLYYATLCYNVLFYYSFILFFSKCAGERGRGRNCAPLADLLLKVGGCRFQKLPFGYIPYLRTEYWLGRLVHSRPVLYYQSTLPTYLS